MTTNEALKQLRAAIEEDIKNGNFHLSDYQPSETYDFHFANINNVDEEVKITLFASGNYGISLGLCNNIRKDSTKGYMVLKAEYLSKMEERIEERIEENKKRIAELQAENETLMKKR